MKKYTPGHTYSEYCILTSWREYMECNGSVINTIINVDNDAFESVGIAGTMIN